MGVVYPPRSAAAKPQAFPPVNRANRYADGLTGFWAFNEGAGVAGNLAHDLARRNDATLTGTGPFYDGLGLRGNGSDSYANAGNAASLNPGTNGAYTLLVGIRTGAIDWTLRNVVFKGDGTAGDIGLLLNFPGAGSWSFQVGTNTYGATTLAANTDYVLGVTYKGGASGPVAVYQNGRLSATGTGSTASKASQNLTFGADAVNGRYFNGTIKWCAYWNGRCLNAADVKHLSFNPYELTRQPGRPQFAPAAAPAGNRRRRVLLCSGGQ